MNPAEIRLLRFVIIKERGAEVFGGYVATPHPLRALLKMFLFVNEETNLDVGGEMVRNGLCSAFGNWKMKK
jgi:hypothetical protein